VTNGPQLANIILSIAGAGHFKRASGARQEPLGAIPARSSGCYNYRGNLGSENLGGIKIISFSIFLEKTVGGNLCKIDQQDLNTSLEFVANQSTRLRVITYDQRMKHAGELYKKLSKAAPHYDPQKYKLEQQVADNYNLMPQFFINIMPMQIAGACGGTILAKLTGYVTPDTFLIPTKAAVFNSTVDIWEKVIGFVGPRQTFSKQAIDVGEQVMKALINDWTASQQNTH
jgi:hypothetical protein